ncbi:uncharacterized protein G6M90_00g048740 [Metarhizium brunneum]|uniref:Uncharacterized protein n=1 Tax=Metarhizium brunneum TaxID=500148 RepID=A0A7D5UW21_9HYPO|nr:hypothetical protein G6M90_00g048740 [Metarhizium brunneum]
MSAHTLPSAHLSNALPGFHFPSCLEKVILLNSRPLLNTNNQVNNTLWILNCRYREGVNDDFHEAAVKQLWSDDKPHQTCRNSNRDALDREVFPSYRLLIFGLSQESHVSIISFTHGMILFHSSTPPSQDSVCSPHGFPIIATSVLMFLVSISPPDPIRVS